MFLNIFFILFLIVLFIIACIFVIEETSNLKHKKFLKSIEGKCLYFSTNKLDFNEINKFVIQNLNKDIIQIVLDSNRVKSIYDTDKIHRLIHKENLRKFPMGIKVVNGKVYSQSFYHIFKNSKDINKEIFILNFVQKWYDSELI